MGHDARIDLSSLRDTLVLLATEQKNFYLMLSQMQNELAAVRETVRGLDPTFSEHLQSKRQKMAQELHASVVERAGILDELIGKAKRVVYYQQDSDAHTPHSVERGAPQEMFQSSTNHLFLEVRLLVCLGGKS